MGTWMGNYDDRAPARFVPASEPARLVRPALAFQPDSSGGYGVPSVTGSRHDQVAKEAPTWFGSAISALAEQKADVSVLARKVGSAGKYNFWAPPVGATSPASWEAMTAEAVAVQTARLSAERLAKEDAALTAERARHEAAAQARNGLVIEFFPGEVVRAPSGAMRALSTSVVLTEEGEEIRLQTTWDGWDMCSQPQYRIAALAA